jgi:hypothetical protein
MSALLGTLAVQGVGMIMNYSNSQKNLKLARDQFEDQKKVRQQQQSLLEEEKIKYQQMKYTNPFDNMENPYEDLTVNQQQAQFQAQQTAQQRANIMQGLKGAAGASGIAGLAQTLANQGALQTQRISASIGQQESANQIAAAKGAASVDLAQRQGDQWVQQANMDRQATILGMQMGQATGANQAYSQAQTNQVNASIAQQQITASMFNATAEAMAKMEWPDTSNKPKPK